MLAYNMIFTELMNYNQLLPASNTLVRLCTWRNGSEKFATWLYFMYLSCVSELCIWNVYLRYVLEMTWSSFSCSLCVGGIGMRFRNRWQDDWQERDKDENFYFCTSSNASASASCSASCHDRKSINQWLPTLFILLSVLKI